LSPFLTTTSFSTRINPAYASRAVLSSVPGLTAADVERLLAASVGDSVPTSAAAAPWLTNAEPKFFRVTSVAQSPRGRAAKDVVVWVRDRGGPVVVETRPAF
ncbi:MAG: hypothetical protein AAGJ87_10660, partial [Pseudomonadota bacterium]